MAALTDPIDVVAIDALARDAGLFLHRLDLIQRRALFVRVGEDELRAASFLDARFSVQDRDRFWLSLNRLSAAQGAPGSAPAPPDFIFHIGHCGSTLLSRLLDASPAVLGLREPRVLRDLAAAKADRHSPQAGRDMSQWQALFARSLTLLGRTFQAGQRVVVKATSSCNDLIVPLLSSFAQARLVLLHVPLESYLATMIKAPDGGLDAMRSAPVRLRYLHQQLRDDSLRRYRLGQPETIAMGWVAEMARFHEIRSSWAATTAVMSLDFEALLLDPELHLAKVRHHLRLCTANQRSSPSTKSAVMRAYAKDPAYAYSPTDREHDLDLSRRQFSVEIASGMRWAEQLLSRHARLAPLAPLMFRHADSSRVL